MLRTRSILAGIVLAALAARVPLRRWGATCDERRRALPGDGLTRLLVRSGATGSPRALTDIINFIVWDPARVVTQLRQLRRHAEGFAPAAEAREQRHEVAAGVR
jgi:hypothetical protein